MPRSMESRVIHREAQVGSHSSPPVVVAASSSSTRRLICPGGPRCRALYDFRPRFSMPFLSPSLDSRRRFEVAPLTRYYTHARRIFRRVFRGGELGEGEARRVGFSRMFGGLMAWQ